jgi:hypothetical protein
MHFAMSQKMTAAQRPLLKLLRDEISPQAGTMVAPNVTSFLTLQANIPALLMLPPTATG